VRYDDLASVRGRWFVTHLSSLRRVIGEPGPASDGTGGEALPQAIAADTRG
jgi:hypothetical protein